MKKSSFYGFLLNKSKIKAIFGIDYFCYMTSELSSLVFELFLMAFELPAIGL